LKASEEVSFSAKNFKVQYMRILMGRWLIWVRGVIILGFWKAFSFKLGVLDFEYVDVVALG